MRDLGPLTDAYSLTSDWDNQWLSGGLEPEVIADAALIAAKSPIEATGSCWVVQHGKAPWAMEFADVPGPDNRLNVPVALHSQSRA